MSDDDIINGIQTPGKFDATVESETVAKRLVRAALPHAVELPCAETGKAYASPPKAAKATYQIHPAEPQVGNTLPHLKYADWTKGKKGRGGSWGHVFFPPPA